MAVTQIKVLKLGAKPPIIEFEGESTDTKPTYGGANSKFTENDTGKKFYFDGSKWKALAASEGGSGGGSDGGASLPANFPAEDAENADKFIGFDENGEYTALDAPSGGGEPFVVTLEMDAQTGKLVGDKTYAEVYEAYTDGQRAVISWNDSTLGQSVYADIFAVGESAEGYIFIVYVGDFATIMCATADINNYFSISMG